MAAFRSEFYAQQAAQESAAPATEPSASGLSTESSSAASTDSSADVPRADAGMDALAVQIQQTPSGGLFTEGSTAEGNGTASEVQTSFGQRRAQQDAEDHSLSTSSMPAMPESTPVHPRPGAVGPNAVSPDVVMASNPDRAAAGAAQPAGAAATTPATPEAEKVNVGHKWGTWPSLAAKLRLR